MKAVILYDSSQPEEAEFIQQMLQDPPSGGLCQELMDLGAEELKPCIGCFGCWVKTPGICVHRKDGGRAFLERIWNADYLIVVTRILWGTYSTRVKQYFERTLPLLHPFFRKVNGEMHHRLRYRDYPALLTVGYGAADADEEQTFIRYTASHRDNILSRRKGGTRIRSEESWAGTLAWITKEIEG